ncbi:alkaline phosphatase D family protein [Neorhodopirellula lusitana]|uniref:alkaline phosphatase D family protein n=1 Tax=Neorhodopirellula lusitana TaxID=445327 RepID=UPI00384FE570
MKLSHSSVLIRWTNRLLLASACLASGCLVCSFAFAHQPDEVDGSGPVTETVGPIVGTVEATTAEFLYRPSATETRLRLTVIDPTGAAVQSVDAKTSADNDFVAKFSVQGLTPKTRYRYQITDTSVSERMLVAADSQHAFVTANPARNDHRVSVAFLSCVDIEPSGIWSDMRQVGVDSVCLMGDTPYIDSVDLATVRDRHRRFLQMPDLAELAATTPTVGTWDDHDFGLNNGNGLSLMKGKQETRRGFVEYRAHSKFGSGTEGVYHKVDLGVIEVFLLDPRYFSQTEPSPVDPDQPTCFGAEQWKWLLENLRASKAPFKVLALGAIWEDKKNKETDDLFTYWYERDALLDMVKEQGIGGVVLLGGDIHVARHLVHPQRVGYDLHDFVISPGHTRTISGLDVYHPSLEWSLVEGWQYLTLTADGSGSNPKLIAEYRQPGKVNRTVSLSLDELSVKPSVVDDSSLRASWSFDGSMKNESVLGDRVDAKPVNGASIVKDAGVRGDAVQFSRAAEQYLVVPRSFLDDNSAGHTVSLWLHPKSLPRHDSSERSFVLESTAEGMPSRRNAYHLSLGLRAAKGSGKVNVQLYTQTLKPAEEPHAAPTAVSQGPFDTLVDRERLLGKWNHLACTFESGRLTLYLNGERIGVHKLPIAGPAAEFGGMVIGGHRDGEGRNFDGLMDEIQVYQSVLSAATIQNLAEPR